jgi:putative SOS response-associated peptidase YedK
VCGRYVTASPPDELARYFGAATGGAELAPNYNVAPTDEVYAVRRDEHDRRLGVLRWGLIPYWAKDRSIGSRMINARVETVATKQAFRRSLSGRRCLIPADGFYEWTAVPGRRTKQPWYIHRPDGEPYAFAGLWDRWRPRSGAGDAEAGPDAPRPDPVVSCTIITGPANEKMAALHDRMPVMLPPSSWDRWLDPLLTDLDAVTELLVPAPVELVAFHAVTTDVNSVRNNGAHLIEPVPGPDVDARSS